MNPMKELYWKQFGGGPDEALLKRMDPTKAFGGDKGSAPRAKKKAEKENNENSNGPEE